MFFKVFKPLKTLKNMSISLITWVIDIAQKAYSTQKKALYNDNFSLENIQNRNPTLKTIICFPKLWEADGLGVTPPKNCIRCQKCASAQLLFIPRYSKKSWKIHKI